ncbi:MAG: glycosyltransferase 87 family protein [Jiangellales bacterium]
MAPATTTAPSRATSSRVALVGLLAAWAVSRAVVMALAVDRLSRATLFNDPNLLWAWANGTAFGSDDTPALSEYPGAARLLALTGRLAETPVAFGWGWIVAMLAVDLALLGVLWQAGRRGAWLWVVAGALLGPVVWLRYDLLVALLAVLAVCWRERRPGWSGVVLALAVLLKLWPLVIVAALLLRTDWRRWLTGFGTTLAAGLTVEVAVRGPSSLLTPLTYQSERGVQIESLFATPVLLASRDEPPEQVWEFAFRAFQLQGSDGTLSSLVTVVVLAVAGLATLAAVQGADPSRLPMVRVTGAALLVVLVVATNSVFSPQYVMWFLPLVALAVAWAPRMDWALVVVTSAVAALTQTVWPWKYESLLLLDPGTLAALAARNGLVLVLAGVLVWRLAGAARAPQPVTNESRT